MGKLDDLVEDIRLNSEPTPKGKVARANAQARVRLAPIAQPLSQGFLPPTYLNHYAWLLRNRPEEAKAFWDKWVVLPRDSRRR